MVASRGRRARRTDDDDRGRRAPRRGDGEPTGPRRVVILAHPGVFSIDVVGPLEVFAVAARMAAQRAQAPAGRASGVPIDPGDVDPASPGLAYRVELVGERAGPVTTSSGLQVVASAALADVRGPVDTFIVAGGSRSGLVAAITQPTLMTQIARVAARARRVASVCSGAFILAAAGLLDGRRATTHWAVCDELATLFPGVKVEPDPIYTRDGRVYTSAGATAGMDLALALVGEDLGRAVALDVARWLVLFLQRPGGQAQFSAQLTAQQAEREPLRDLQAWITDHPTADLSVPTLAARAAMSVRNFARAFTREVGATPAAYVEQVRVEAARRRLEAGAASIEEIAAATGFGTVETLRRAFSRRVGVAPAAYRARFRATARRSTQGA